ncbi:MAG: gliding motility protein GldN [Bacteroidales bacterium]|nr:gliding motility protein GldN [Bacteroidales bacterium]
MRILKYIIPILLFPFLTGNLIAQEEQERTSRNRNKKEDKNSELTVRAQAMNDQLTVNIDQAPWKRIVYRFIDLKEEKNTPLYYPAQPTATEMNLFTTLFRLMAQGKIPAYEYIDGYEEFTDQYKSNLKDILDRFNILYKEEPVKNSKSVSIEIDNSDIPSEEVLGYYMKEVWFFDQKTSTYNSQIISICPILFRTGDFGGEATRYPMFWFTYESIRPYISKNPVMTSNLNNAKILTLDDYFRKRMFKGEIFKVANLMNRPLMQYCENEEALKAEQERIEKELVSFEESLWTTKADTTEISKEGSDKAEKATASRGRGSSRSSASKSSNQKVKEAKAPKSKAPKAAMPVRSVRKQR